MNPKRWDSNLYLEVSYRGGLVGPGDGPEAAVLEGSCVKVPSRALW